MTTNPEPERPAATGDDGIDWSLCTWKGSRREQHLSYLALPFRRKLELLEEMCDFARWTMESRRRRGLPFIDPYTGERVGPAPVPTGGPAVTSPAAGEG